MSEDKTERAKAVQEKYSEQLMSKPHVVGTAIGLRMRQGQYTGEVAIVVMVSKKVAEDELKPEDKLPEELDGIPVDVQETGTFVAQ
jgi:hypothetical protein